jgi:hypothetical protein
MPMVDGIGNKTTGQNFAERTGVVKASVYMIERRIENHRNTFCERRNERYAHNVLSVNTYLNST